MGCWASSRGTGGEEGDREGGKEKERGQRQRVKEEGGTLVMDFA